MRRIFILFLVVNINTTLLFSQSDLFEEGYVILSSGDTLLGFVKDPSARNSLFLSVTFSESQSGEDQIIYSPFEVKEFYFEPGFCFVSRDNELSDNPQKIFLQCLVKGYASLFTYTLKQNQIFILEKDRETIIPLKKIPGREELDQDSRNKLETFFSDCSDMESKMDNMELSEDDLIKGIRQYNRCLRASKETITYKTGKDKNFRAGITTGINLSELKIQAPIPYKDIDLKTGLGFNVGFGLEFYFLNRFSANVKIMWVSFNASLWNHEMPLEPDTAVRRDDVLFNFSYIDFPVKLKVNLTQDRLKTFLFAGLWYGVLVEEDIAVQSTIPQFSTTYSLYLEKLKQGYTLGFGFSIPSSRRSEILFELGYIHQKATAQQTDGLTLQNFYLQMSYLF